MDDDTLARRLCLAALELQAGNAAMWISVGRIAERLGIDDMPAIDRAINHARLAGWLSVGGMPPISVLPKHGRLRDITAPKRPGSFIGSAKRTRDSQ